MTLVILTVKRAVPYVAVLVAMLLRGHDPALFMEKMDVHVVNIERRAGRERYHLFTDLRDKLGKFVHFHDWTEKYPQHANASNPYVPDQRLDYSRALEICRAAASKWCVVMEDDAVPPVDFASKFERYVDRDVFPNALTRVGRDPEDVPLDRVAVVKLYDHYNERGLQGHDLSHPDYARDDYDRDRALDLREQAAVDGKVKYTVLRTGTAYGIIANAYPYRVLGEAAAFLREGKLAGSATPTDSALLGDFVNKARRQRLVTNPSLVNHLGFYSENRGADWTTRGVSTDVRFQLDDGPPDVSDAGTRRRDES